MSRKSTKSKLSQPSEPATLAPIAEYHERKIAEDREAYDGYRPTRGSFDAPRNAASSILRAVEKGGEIQLATLTELLELLAAKTDYRFHAAVEIQPTGSALLKTIDNERDAQETIRRLKAKP